MIYTGELPAKEPLPRRVTIELTNRCSRNCPGCPRTMMHYPQGYMDFELLDKILGQLPSNTVIVPFYRGESLMHPRFSEALWAIKQKGFDRVQLATNGDLLGIETSAVIYAATAFTSISLHDYHLPKADQITEFLTGARYHPLVTQVSIVESMIPPSGAYTKKRFIAEWLQYTDRVRIYVEHSHQGFGDVDPKHRDTAYRQLGQRLPCPKPFDEMVVYWDGKVALCNHDWDNKAPLGDLNTQSVKAVWNSKPYEEVRELHTDRYGDMVASCKHCDYWMVPYLKKGMFGEVYT